MSSRSFASGVGPGLRLEGPRVVLRQPLESDAETLVAILTEPAVARWWPPFDRARVLVDLIGARDDEQGFVIEHRGRVIGYIQCAEEPDPEFRHASIDLFLTATSHGHGFGPAAIRLLAAELVDRRGHHRITIDPVADNTQAITAYAKVGFRPVGVLRQYQRMTEGTWADALLMDLLAGELVRDSPDEHP